MVTKGYQKGVYEWVTLGISGLNGWNMASLVQKRYVARAVAQCNLPAAL
jgi:hypothetical protein